VLDLTEEPKAESDKKLDCHGIKNPVD